MERSSFSIPVWRMGKSVVIPLYKLLCSALGIMPGDILIARVHPPFVTFRLLDPRDLVPLEKFTPEDYPPKLEPKPNGR